MPKVLIITGASRGIGAATARLAATRGYHICVNYLNNQAAAQQVVDDAKQLGAKTIAVRADASNESDVLNLFRTTEQQLGKVSALVNNVGVLKPQSRLADMDAARMQHILNTNVMSCMLCCKQAIRHMSTAMGGPGGSIVNVSSIAAKLGSPTEYVDYAASKGAIDTLTIGLAKELAQEGIRVNAVRPAFIRTDIHADASEPNRVDRIAKTIPMRRPGEPEEVANAILWLLSDEASFTTGSFVDLAGGV